MRSSERVLAALVLLGALGATGLAAAQQVPQGFAVERFYPSTPGGGWFVMDALDMRGGVGGAMSVTTGYAHDPLRVTDGTQRTAVVSDQAFVGFGVAATYDRWRLSLDLAAPLAIQGNAGSAGDYALTPPSVSLGSNPDTLADVRLGADVRLLGEPRGPFRLGAGAQVYLPEGSRADYDSDGTVRAMFRALAAGDVGPLVYAGQLGVHVRPVDDTPAPGSPRGSELLFGIAAGAKLPLDAGARTVVVVGPEVYGETALRAFFGTTATGLEGLMTARVEGTGDDGPQLRVKLGAGGGLDAHFGAPEWRMVLGVELFDHASRRRLGGR